MKNAVIVALTAALAIAIASVVLASDVLVPNHRHDPVTGDVVGAPTASVPTAAPAWEPPGPPPPEGWNVRGPYDQMLRIVPQVSCAVYPRLRVPSGNAAVDKHVRAAVVIGRVWVFHNWGGAIPANEWGAYSVTIKLTVRSPYGVVLVDSNPFTIDWGGRFWSREGYRGFTDVEKPYYIQRWTWAEVGHTTNTEDLSCEIEATYDPEPGPPQPRTTN